MKYILIALLVTVKPAMTFAQNNMQGDTVTIDTMQHSAKNSVQKYNLYADVGASFQNAVYPGLSVTYSYALTKHFGIGVGVQGYKFSPTISNEEVFTPAVYGDLRLKIHPREKGFLFSFLDLGVDFYKHNNDSTRDGRYIQTVTKNNGFYTGLGLGYFHSIARHNGGIYASLKIIMNGYRPNRYNMATKESDRNEQNLEGTAVISIGYKF